MTFSPISKQNLSETCRSVELRVKSQDESDDNDDCEKPKESFMEIGTVDKETEMFRMYRSRDGKFSRYQCGSGSKSCVK